TVDPVLKRLAARARKGCALQLTVLHGHDPPAAGLANIVKAAEHAAAGGAVERRSAILDNRPAVAHAVLVVLDQAFVALALLGLGVAHQGDHSARLFRGEFSVGDQIVLNEPRKGGDGNAEPDRARRKVDRNLVLRPRGVALRAPESAKTLE